jgi:prepilin-type N-terminal cleavage/methylation domain-containing protein
MKRVSERGYNLVEILVAIALLGVVMMAILSLFVWGRKNVYSGKQMTAAIAVGTRVLEDLAPLTKRDIYSGVFSIADTSTGVSEVKFGTPEKTYKNAAFRSTKAGIVSGVSDLQTQNPNGPKFLTAWEAQLYEKTGPLDTDKRLRLDDGSVTLILMPRSDTNSPPQFGTASLMQIRVVVSWLENRRRREVILDSVKAQ